MDASLAPDAHADNIEMWTDKTCCHKAKYSVICGRVRQLQMCYKIRLSVKNPLPTDGKFIPEAGDQGIFPHQLLVINGIPWRNILDKIITVL